MDGFSGTTSTPHCSECHRFVDRDTIFEEETFDGNPSVSYGTCRTHGMVAIYWTEHSSTKLEVRSRRGESGKYEYYDEYASGAVVE